MALDFSNHFVREATNGDINPGPTTTFTVSAWVRPDTTPAEMRITNRWGLGGTSRQFLLSLVSGVLRVAINGGGGADICDGSGALSTGVWHAVALRKNGTGAGALQAWVDGAQNGSVTSNQTMQSVGNVTGSQFRVGGAGAGSFLPFDGRIAEVCLWSVALTDDELVALAKGVSAKRIRPGAHLYHWPLWGSNYVDLGANRYQLIDTGSPAGSPAVVDHAPVGSPFPVAA